MVDPRLSIIQERIRDVNRVVAVSSGKGGVGKSLLASTLALLLARGKWSIGLFDLDFTSPSTHLILGIRGILPTEDKGIVPPLVHGLKYMSVIYYSQDKMVPLRGTDFSNALIELLSVTKWGKLDFLIVDMPPGIGDATLDLIRFVKKAEFLIVTTSSPLAFETVKKLMTMLKELGVPILGVVENMKTGRSNIQQEALKLGVRFLGEIPYDPRVENSLGNAYELLKTVFASRVGDIVKHLT
ncbi:MAG: P-loop NTPase [Candidatus Brockarchaeota archaeon]|nr:P-loop NTPase [Candidatus Brockarchaeota archaeon]